MPVARRFLPVYAASGTAALIYEVAWTRELTLTMGHGTAAAATVLAAFMGGLAVGAAVAGHMADRLPAARALRLYAGLELAVALLALLLPAALAATRPVLATVYADGGGGATFAAVRLVTCVLLLSLPAAAMGATFPLAARWFTPQVRTSGAAGAGLLYTVNTLGATGGAILAGFVLLPTVGLRATVGVAVVLNVAAAAAAWWLAGGDAAPDTSLSRPPDGAPSQAPARRRSAPTSRPVEIPPARPTLAALALGWSGFASLAMQLVWTRVLALVLGPTSYAFSTVVAVFIAGLATGAAIGTRLVGRLRTPGPALAVCLAVAGAAGIGAGAFVDASLLRVASVVAGDGVTFNQVLLQQALIATALLVPMALAFGAAFPLALALGTGRPERLSSDLGFIYAVNTAGAIAGSLVTGFVLLDRLGLQGMLRVVAAGGAVAAVVVLSVATSGRWSRVAGVACAVAAGAAAFLLPPWNASLLASGAYKYAPQLRGQSLDTTLTAGQLLFYREGATGTVAVREATGTTSLSIDGKVDASNAGDMLTQRLLAHVPLLLHPAPSRVAILGLGSGVTLGSALRHPIQQADVLEISPDVVAASRFFAPETGEPLADRRTRLVVGDGRSHLLLSQARYDVIVSEPSNPWMAGIASLFTQEFFQAARARLAPGGVLCQWAHTYDISRDDLRSIVGTFLSVFPDGTLWLVGDGDVLLVGSTAPLGSRLAGMAGAWQRPGVREDLAAIGASGPFAVLSLYVAGGEALARFASGAPLQRDDLAGLEFTGPRSVFSAGGDDNAAALRALQAESTPPDTVARARRSADGPAWRDRGRMLLRASAARPAWDDFRRALDLSPADAEALQGLIDSAPGAGRQDETARLLATLAADPANEPAQLARSHLLTASGNAGDGAAVALAAVERHPGSVPALAQLASVLLDVGDRDRLVPVVARLRTVAPDADDTRYYTASLLFLEGRHELAVREARALVERTPTHARGFNLLGAALATIGQTEPARDALTTALRLQPRDATTYTNLGLLDLQTGRRASAVRRLSEALSLEPANQAAADGLARARAGR